MLHSWPYCISLSNSSHTLSAKAILSIYQIIHLPNIEFTSVLYTCQCRRECIWFQIDIWNSRNSYFYLSLLVRDWSLCEYYHIYMRQSVLTSSHELKPALHEATFVAATPFLHPYSRSNVSCCNKGAVKPLRHYFPCKWRKRRQKTDWILLIVLLLCKNNHIHTENELVFINGNYLCFVLKVTILKSKCTPVTL